MAKRDKLWALLGIIGFFLINYPLLEIFNQDILIAGSPILLLYLFGVWILAIAALYGFVRQLISKGPEGQKKS